MSYFKSFELHYNIPRCNKETIFSEAWLKAAELTPTWVWALVDLPETMHATYHENPQFLNIIQQVRYMSYGTTHQFASNYPFT
uniref:Uncharacterized protein n=1 Tax=Heterorhabditis bacteriophora TaxID=37862 RepID=A0A1I7WVY7_HETBA